jgi:Helix-turn-helix domain
VRPAKRRSHWPARADLAWPEMMVGPGAAPGVLSLWPEEVDVNDGRNLTPLATGGLQYSSQRPCYLRGVWSWGDGDASGSWRSRTSTGSWSRGSGRSRLAGRSASAARPATGGEPNAAGSRRCDWARRTKGRYLSQLERQRIATLRDRGLGVPEVARRLGRSPSTVSRELRRNLRPHDGGAYDADLAHARARERARRHPASRLAVDQELRQVVQDKLELEWSPEQIAPGCG